MRGASRTTTVISLAYSAYTLLFRLSERPICKETRETYVPDEHHQRSDVVPDEGHAAFVAHEALAPVQSQARYCEECER